MGQVLIATLPAQTAAGADSTTEVGQISTVQGTDNYLARCEFIPPPGFTTVTGQATNNFTGTLRQLRAGAVLVANVATITTALNTNLAAETPLAMTINATQAQQANFQQGDVLDLLMHQNGTGQAIGAGVVVEVELA